MFSLYDLHPSHAPFRVKRFIHSQAPVPLTHYSFYCSYHLLCQSRCCLEWSFEVKSKMDGLLVLQTVLASIWGTRGIPMWNVMGHLLSDLPFNPTLAMPIICYMLSTKYWVIMGDFNKTVVTFTFLLRLPACGSTDCHYQHSLSFSRSSPPEYISSCSKLIRVCMYAWLLLVSQGCRHVNMF